MNDLTAILGSIQADAEGAGKSALDNARAAAAKIEQDYRRQADSEAAKITADGERQAEAVRRRAESQAGIDMRNSALSVRRGMISRSFDRALQKLCALPDGDKAELYAKLASKYAAGGGELTLSAADGGVAGLLGKKLGDGSGIKVSDKTGKFAGGFILSQGKTELNCTFEVLIAGVKDEVEPEVAGLLFR